MKNKTVVLSLGVGVQSSTMLLMAQNGFFDGDRPDYAIFADPGKEPQAVYEYLEYLTSVSEIPIIVYAERNIETDLYEHIAGRKKRVANPPFFIINKEGKPGMLKRICTKEYKIEMVERAIRRKIFGLQPRQRIPKGEHVEMWIGISTDEIERVKPSQTPWVTKRHILVDYNISRNDCLKWMQEKGYQKPPKSSCTFCPYHSDKQWAELKNSPEWPDIVKMDNAIRNGLRGTNDGTQLFLHRSRRPIDDVEFKEGEQLDMFAEECMGMCGL